MAAAKTVPIYYTLAHKGKAWLEDEAPKPAKYSKIVATLGEMLAENDVPRTSEQVAFSLGQPLPQIISGLSYLKKAGYVVEARPPQPSAKGQVVKIRIRPIEELAAAEAKAEAARIRYATGEKGKAAHKHYEDSPKGRAKNIKYWTDPGKGRKVQKAYRLRRRQKELLAHLATHPEDKAKIRPLLDDVAKRLAEMPKEEKHAVD